MAELRGIDIYLTGRTAVLEAARAAAVLSEIGPEWVFEGRDGEAWARAAEGSDAGWIAWHETGLDTFPFKLDLNLLNGRDPLGVAHALADRLDADVAVPDEASLDPEQFSLLSPGGASRPISIEIA